MTITALVMAGGKGSRMIADTEKPLLEILGKPMVLHVVEALQGSEYVKDIVVATSHHTPITTQILKSLGVRTFETLGRGYVEDTQATVRSLQLGKTLVISADLPLITSEFINEVVQRYESSGKPALTVTVSKSLKDRSQSENNEGFQHNNMECVHVGVNVLDGNRISEAELDEEVMVVEKSEVTMNVNTSEDLEQIRSMMKETRCNPRV